MLKKYYIDDAEFLNDTALIYFPLHVPGDAALTIRSPKYLDQISLIDYIARNIPSGTSLYVKEHPAQIGAFKVSEIGPVLKRFDNVKLVSPKVNNFDIMGKAKCVISINSKSGAEAVALGKNVLVLGDAFYADSKLVTPVKDLDELFSALQKLINEPVHFKQEEIVRYFQGVWHRSACGELYDLEPKNISIFGDDLLRVIGS